MSETDLTNAEYQRLMKSMREALGPKDLQDDYLRTKQAIILAATEPANKPGQNHRTSVDLLLDVKRLDADLAAALARVAMLEAAAKRALAMLERYEFIGHRLGGDVSIECIECGHQSHERGCDYAVAIAALRAALEVQP